MPDAAAGQTAQGALATHASPRTITVDERFGGVLRGHGVGADPAAFRLAVGVHRAGRSSPMPNVSDFLIRRLTDWRVDRIYGYPGDGINGIMGALGRAGADGPRFVQVRH
ncbi:MAG TPA: hypothetical protein VM684_17990, partial [Gaiellales bacterium]|nr:hypothetical protein [Gaiellales bacterium]